MALLDRYPHLIILRTLSKLGGLAGLTDPEAKRKFIGKTFIDIFDAEAKKIVAARPSPDDIAKILSN